MPENDRLDVEKLCADIAASGTPAHAFTDTDDILRFVLSEAKKGDVLLVMSNGAFGGLVGRLLAGLEARSR